MLTGVRPRRPPPSVPSCPVLSRLGPCFLLQGGFQLLNPAFLRRAIGAVWTAPAVAVGVLRAMLVCPSEILLAVGEEGLKELLPKVLEPYIISFPAIDLLTVCTKGTDCCVRYNCTVLC